MPPDLPAVPGMPIVPGVPAMPPKAQGPLLPHQVMGLRAGGTIGTQILQRTFPVGCIYMSTIATNPADVFGFGTWVAFAQGRVLVGVGTSDQAFLPGFAGGESSHTLTTAEMPAHTHNAGNLNASRYGIAAASNTVFPQLASDSYGNNAASSSAGGGTSHNNLQPYLVVYIWNRTA